jgi:anhydro-N-acetylmuramic acid kinase
MPGPRYAASKLLVTMLQNHTNVSLKALGELDAATGAAFGKSALRAISARQLEPRQIRAIGSHGQTFFH